MATTIETEDCKILIDPGLSVVSERYGLAPHPFEIWTLKKFKERIHLYAQYADLIIISHYHENHFSSDTLELYEGKTLLLKNPNQSIPLIERDLAFNFIKALRNIAKEVDFIDGRKIDFGKTQITFSPPVRHSGYPQGFTLHVSIRTPNKSFLFLPDMHDWCDDKTVDFIQSQNPSFIYLDGPLTYLLGDANSKKNQDDCFQKIKMVVESTQVQNIILDHHLLRDLHWRERIKPLLQFVKRKGIHLQTAAEYRGEENSMLEARRAELYENDPP